MVRLALWLAQMPGTVPDLVWWVLGISISLLNVLAAVLARVLWNTIDERLKRLEKWQEDHEP